MESQSQNRQSVRIDCHIKAQVTRDERLFDGTLINRSFSGGAMYFCVHFSGLHFPYAEPGEECLLLFGDNNQHSYATTVVRVASDRLVLAVPTVRSWLAEREPR
ncbi:MAG: PilZ domain-containing protein [Desulfuromonadales bacterium]